MPSFQTIVLAAMASTLALASPAPQDRTANVNIYSSDTCGNPTSKFSVEGSGAYRCVPVTNARSILVTGSGCFTQTWSGNNCRGSAFHVPDSACHSVLYGSVSVKC